MASGNTQQESNAKPNLGPTNKCAEDRCITSKAYDTKQTTPFLRANTEKETISMYFFNKLEKMNIKVRIIAMWKLKLD